MKKFIPSTIAIVLALIVPTTTIADDKRHEVEFQLNEFRGHWGLAIKGQILSEGLEGCKPSPIKRFADKHLKVENCTARLLSGKYMFVAASMGAQLNFEVNESGSVAIQGLENEVMAVGGDGSFELQVSQIEIARNGYAGALGFENIIKDSEGTNKDRLLPRGATWLLTAGRCTTTQVRTDRDNNVSVSNISAADGGAKALLSLKPEAVLIVPLNEAVDAQWTIDGSERADRDEFIAGSREVSLIPGMNHQLQAKIFGAMHNFDFAFENRCNIKPSRLTFGITGSEVFRLIPSCAIQESNPVPDAFQTSCSSQHSWKRRVIGE